MLPNTSRSTLMRTDSFSLISSNSSSSSLSSQRNSKRIEAVSKQTTKVSPVLSKLEWNIDQFEKLMKLYKNGANLISKQFLNAQAPSVIWELHVYPNGKREEDSNNVSFFLRQVGLQRGEDPIMTEFQIYTLDGGNQRISVCRDTKDFSNQQGRGKFQVAREKMLGALRMDGNLMLICEVEYLPPGAKITVEKEEENEANDDQGASSKSVEVSIRDSLREMLENELFTDCTIQVDTKSYNAHRCVLGQHSMVFRSMFGQKNMLEAQNGHIHITDSRPEPIRAMLEYIYTGSITSNLMENYAQGILAIADKYAIIPLKEYCERYLAGVINKKNFTTMAFISDMYCADYLKKACIRYISQHHKSIIRSPEWKEFKTVRGELANDLLECVLEDQSPMDGTMSNVSSIESEDSSSMDGGISLLIKKKKKKF